MFIKLVFVLSPFWFSVFGQDESYFDTYTISGLPWKTKDARSPRTTENFMDISRSGRNIDETLKNYRTNHRALGLRDHNFHKNNYEGSKNILWYDSEGYGVNKRWNHREDILETHFDEYFDKNKWTPEKLKDPEPLSAELESEFGQVIATNEMKPQHFEPVKIFVQTTTPKYSPTITPKYSFPNDTRFTGLSHVQKISKNEAANFTRQNNINSLLKQYMNKLYTRKYQSSRYVEIDPNDIDSEKGKFFGNGLEALAILKNKTKKIANKFLNVFQVVKFNNTACTGTLNGFQYQGTCYLATECASLNGTAAGSCANGYGVCCIFRGTCGGTAGQNCSYFESPNYPDYYPPNGGVVPPTPTPTPVPTPAPTTPDLRPDPRFPWLPREYFGRQMDTLDCTFQVSKASSDIQQMRIDFLDLELLGPTNGTCVNERLVISGNGINSQIPVVCGYNTGQHVYVDVSLLNGPLMLSVLSNMSYRKRFRVRICQYSQMACMTPNNCLQYYTGASGVISSFNYDQALMLSRSTPSYFNNLNYAICIRREAGYCSITYTNVMNGLEYPFQLVNFAANGMSTVMPGRAGIETMNCPNDYIIINGVRLCGYKLNDGTINRDLTMNAPVTDNSQGPIVIPVRTNGAAVGRGFKLYYTQNRCPSSF